MLIRILVVFLLGFSSGLPFSLLATTLQAWFTTQGLSIEVIGLLGLVSQPYSIRFLWAPLLDKYSLSRHGRRKSWIVLCQILLCVGMIALANLNPKSHAFIIAIIGVFLAVASATQDIAIDAYRTEILLDNEKGIGATFTVMGYRVATLVSGGLSLIFAQYYGWQFTFLLMALIMGLMIVVTAIIKEPTLDNQQQQAASLGYRKPFLQLINRRNGLWALAFIFLFKLGEAFTSTSSGMVMVFLLNGLGFDLATVGLVNKIYAIYAVIAGGFIAGIVMLRMQLFNALFIFGVFQVIANAFFVVLASSMKSYYLLVAVVVIDNLAVGMGTTALVAFLMWWCDKRFSASQFALMSALSALPRLLANPITGYLQPVIGWTKLFEIALILSLPCLLTLIKLKASQPQSSRNYPVHPQ